jgi:hypothetical protein
MNRKWTRRCQFYQKALTNTSIKLGISEDDIERIVLKYLYKCKQLIMQGKKVQLPGIIYMSAHHTQLKKMRRFLSYKGMKARYGDKDYFKKHILKTKK